MDFIQTSQISTNRIWQITLKGFILGLDLNFSSSYLVVYVAQIWNLNFGSNKGFWVEVFLTASSQVKSKNLKCRKPFDKNTSLPCVQSLTQLGPLYIRPPIVRTSCISTIKIAQIWKRRARVFTLKLDRNDSSSYVEVYVTKIWSQNFGLT